MKNVIFTLLIISFVLFSCKTKKAVTRDEGNVVPKEQVAESITEPVEEATEPEGEAKIVVKTEEVSVAATEDQSKKGYAYYVIIGSFSKAENAANFKAQLISKGFSPVLLNSETGMVRVAVDQSNLEQEARGVVMRIRQQYPEHKDVWLLKSK